jgi:DNA-binding NarL/FixJ family response regulator
MANWVERAADMKTFNSAAAGGSRPLELSAPLIIEEKPICRDAIGRVVQSCGDFGPMEFAATLAEAQARLDAGATPPLLLVDLFSINYDFEGLERLVLSTARRPVAVIDDRVNPSFSERARAAGALGYWAKEYDIQRFRAALLTVIGGGASFPETAPPPKGRRGQRSGAGLSARQLAVLKEMAVGKTNREIAEALEISTGTVKLHIHAILRLIGARNRTEAALIAGRFLASQPPAPATRRAATDA